MTMEIATNGERNGERLVIDAPRSLLEWLEIRARCQGLTSDEAMTRLLEGLPGLQIVDLKSLKNPPKESRRTVRLRVSKRGALALDESSSKSGLGRSLICSKLLYGLLVSQQVRITWDPELNQFLLQRTQLHFDFAGKNFTPEK
jgi:hypothetical protein